MTHSTAEIIAILIATGVGGFILGIAATVLYLIRYGRTVEEANAEFEERLSKGEIL